MVSFFTAKYAKCVYGCHMRKHNNSIQRVFVVGHFKKFRKRERAYDRLKRKLPIYFYGYRIGMQVNYSRGRCAKSIGNVIRYVKAVCDKAVVQVVKLTVRLHG